MELWRRGDKGGTLKKTAQNIAEKQVPTLAMPVLGIGMTGEVKWWNLGVGGWKYPEGGSKLCGRKPKTDQSCALITFMKISCDRSTGSCICLYLPAPLPHYAFRAHTSVIVARGKVTASRSFFQCHVIHDIRISCDVSVGDAMTSASRCGE